MNRILSLICLFVLSGINCRAQIFARLKTADTTIRLRAGLHAPKLVSLQSAGHISWNNRNSEALISYANASGKAIPIDWKLNANASHVGRSRVSYVYDCFAPRLRLTWEWEARAKNGPIEHGISIQNLGAYELWLPMQDSLGFDWQLSPRVSLEHMYIEKGADTPSPVGTHRVLIPPAYKWQATSSTYARPVANQPREIIPWTLVQRTTDQSGWFIGLEFSGRTRIALVRNGKSLRGSAGLNPDPGPFRTRVKPGETFKSPTVFIGAFTGGADAAGNTLRPWVRQVLGNPLAWNNSSYPLLVNNSWGSGMQVDEAIAHRMIADSAELGLEMFHLDAGWFRGVGDWYPNPGKFPHGLAAIADDAHRHELRFGIWVDWTQAGLDGEPGALNARDPSIRDWLVADLDSDWKTEPFKGQTIDIGYPPAKQWAERELDRMIRDYRLDMLEHDGYLVAQGCVREDHPHALPDLRHTTISRVGSSYFVDGPNSTDVSYHAVRAYYSIYSRLREKHPGILLEACNDGGRMVDFGTAAHVDYFSITDTYDPLSNRRAFYDASFLLPPAMLESYVEKWPTASISNFRYMLRSGMMGWFTLMLDTTAWTAEQHAAAKQEFQIYKQKLRPLIRDAQLYHISPRPDGVHWDGIEYYDPQRRAGVSYLFHGSAHDEEKHRFRFKGLERNCKYRLHFNDATSPDSFATGRQLMADGVEVELRTPNTSELVFFEGAGKRE